MHCNEPGTGDVDEMVQLVSESDTVDSGVHGKEEEEDIGNVTKTEQ